MPGTWKVLNSKISATIFTLVLGHNSGSFTHRTFIDHLFLPGAGDTKKGNI